MSLRECWLDLGSGINAEHWAATEAPARVLRVAMDPLLTSGMIASGRLEPLPRGVLRVGAEVRPEGSVEAGKARSFLPFRDEVFIRVHCGYVLHLYLETLELLVAECYRVLRPGGEFEVLLPHFGDAHSEGVHRRTRREMEACFGAVEASRFAGPFTTFWADLYQDRTYLLRSIRREFPK